MSKTKFNLALTLLVISALVAGVGCGNGKSNKRARTRPAAPGADANKPKTPAPPATNPDGTTPDPKNTPPPADGDGDSPTTGADPAERKKKQERITAIWTQLVEGTPLNTTDLEPGTYTLEGSATEIKIMPGNGQWVQSVSIHVLEGGFPQREHEEYGILPDNAESFAYSVLVPSIFNIENRAGQPKPNPVSYVLTSKLGSLDKSHTKQGLKDSLEDAGSSEATAKLLELIAGKNTDSTGKKVVLNAWKTADSKVRFQLSIDEIPKPSEKKESSVRNIILTFAFKAKAAEVAAVKPVADDAPATAPVQKIPVETDAAE